MNSSAGCHAQRIGWAWLPTAHAHPMRWAWHPYVEVRARAPARETVTLAGARARTSLPQPTGQHIGSPRRVGAAPTFHTSENSRLAGWTARRSWGVVGSPAGVVPDGRG